MGLLDKFRGRSVDEEDVHRRLETQEELTEDLDRRVQLLEAHVAVFQYRRQQRGDEGGLPQVRS